jgi:hypothetical protein
MLRLYTAAAIGGVDIAALVLSGRDALRRGLLDVTLRMNGVSALHAWAELEHIETTDQQLKDLFDIILEAGGKAELLEKDERGDTPIVRARRRHHYGAACILAAVPPNCSPLLPTATGTATALTPILADKCAKDPSVSILFPLPSTILAARNKGDPDPCPSDFDLACDFEAAIRNLNSSEVRRSIERFVHVSAGLHADLTPPLGILNRGGTEWPQFWLAFNMIRLGQPGEVLPLYNSYLWQPSQWEAFTRNFAPRVLEIGTILSKRCIDRCHDARHLGVRILLMHDPQFPRELVGIVTAYLTSHDPIINKRLMERTTQSISPIKRRPRATTTHITRIRCE